MASKSMTKRLYIQELGKIMEIVLKKTDSYDSAFIKESHFNKLLNLTPEIRILSRIDEKLYRLESNKNYDNEDTEKDLIGYLILLSTYLTYKDVINKTNANDYIKENCDRISTLYVKSELSKDKCIKCFVESPFDIENLNFIIAKLVLEKENIDND